MSWMSVGLITDRMACGLKQSLIQVGDVLLDVRVMLDGSLALLDEPIK